jgi:hypothetical protein
LPIEGDAQFLARLGAMGLLVIADEEHLLTQADALRVVSDFGYSRAGDLNQRAKRLKLVLDLQTRHLFDKIDRTSRVQNIVNEPDYVLVSRFRDNAREEAIQVRPLTIYELVVPEGHDLIAIVADQYAPPGQWLGQDLLPTVTDLVVVALVCLRIVSRQESERQETKRDDCAQGYQRADARYHFLIPLFPGAITHRGPFPSNNALANPLT